MAPPESALLLPAPRADNHCNPAPADGWNTMDWTSDSDYYERLQISANAEPETIHRVYRLLAPRFHPDNLETGDESRFREITEAYQTLSDPEKRAQYDIVHEHRKQQRWRLVSQSAKSDNDFDAEKIVRLTILEVLYSKRRTEPYEPSIPQPDLEEISGKPREHLEFTIWFLMQKKLITRADNMNITITADGVEYIEENYRKTLETRRLQAAPK
jgi:curved DNA-binding protein CbpA